VDHYDSISSLLPAAAADDMAMVRVGRRLLIDVLANDFSPCTGMDSATVQIVTAPAHGIARVRPDGIVVYRPNRGFVGLDQFTYTFADFDGVFSNAAVVTVDVTRRGGGLFLSTSTSTAPRQARRR
jgi:adhesin/invasin